MPLQQDIITRQINLLIQAILRSTELRREEQDVDALAEVEDVLQKVTGMDAQTLLRMDPSSFVMMLEIAQVSDQSAVWIDAGLEIQAQLYERSEQPALAQLREQQAAAVRQSFRVTQSFDEILALAQQTAANKTDDTASPLTE